MKSSTWRLGLVLCAWAGMVWAGEPVYTLAVVPQLTPQETGKRWTPLLQRLEAVSGVRIGLRLSNRFQLFEEEFKAGLPDFIYLNPYQAVMAAKAKGYEPLLRSRRPLSGILVVDGAGPIQKVADLAGQTLVFPAPNAFGASLYMRALLAEQEKLQFQTRYVGSHQNVYRSVMLGDAAGGGGVEATLKREQPGLRARLKVLYTTPGVASHPLVVHPRVSRAVRERVRQTLLDMTGDDAALLAGVELSEPVVADYARDYAPLEHLGLDRYADLD
jgi:phosphonate transport system substrate-binding protein